MVEAQIAIERLKEIEDLLSVPERWTKGYYAKTASGLNVSADNPQAVCWCIYGAIEKVCTRHSEEDKYLMRCIGEAITIKRQKIYTWRGLDSFNDSPATKHADILEVLEKAIELETAKI